MTFSTDKDTPLPAPMRQTFEALAAKLSSPEALQMTASEVEELIFNDGMVMLDQLRELYAASVASSPPPAPPTPSDESSSQG